MLDLLTPQLIVGCACIAGLAWARPWLAIGFVVLGSVPYYALLQVLGVQTSAALTGGVFAAAGAGALARVGGSWSGRGRHLVLFGAFVGLWYIQWTLNPPPLISSDVEDFASRASLLMVAFGILPFLVGMSASTRERQEKLLGGLAFWGASAILVGVMFWVLGMPNLGPEWSMKWEPIRYLTGIIFALDVALGSILLLGLWAGRHGTVWLITKATVVVVSGLLVMRIGQRGPFLSYVAGLLVLTLSERTGRRRRLIVAASMLAVIAGLGVFVSENYTARPVAMESYSADANLSRLALLERGARAILEKPVLGWGGSLVGESVGEESWRYLHVFLLDPILETGLVGAFLLWWLFYDVLSILWRARRTDRTGVTMAAVFVAAFLEGQLSGHVSGAKHIWLLTGMVVAAGQVRRVTVGRTTEVAPVNGLAARADGAP